MQRNSIMSPAEAATAVAATTALTMPLWHQFVSAASTEAAVWAPILATLWLVIQIGHFIGKQAGWWGKRK